MSHAGGLLLANSERTAARDRPDDGTRAGERDGAGGADRPQEGLLEDWRAAQESLQASEERFRIVAESTSDLIYEWDIDSGCIYWYGDVDGRLGYDKGEFPRTIEAWEAAIHPQDHDRVMEALRMHLEDGVPYDVEYRVRRKNGGIRHWIDRGKALRDEKGSPRRMIGTCTDITERKLAEEGLRRSEESFRLLYEEAPLGYQSLNSHGTITDVNRAWLGLFGYSREEALVRSFRELLAPGELDHFMDRFRRSMACGEMHGAEFAVLKKDGGRLLISFDGKVSYDVQKGEKKMHCILNDITGRRAAEDAQRESEKRYRTLADNSPDIIARFDSRLRHIYMSPSIEKMSGKPAADFIGKTHNELGLPDGMTELWRAKITEVFRTARPGTIEFEMPTPTSSRSFHGIIVPEPSESGAVKSVLSVVRDITDIKRAGEALRKSEERYRRIVETTREGVWVIDSAARTTFVNGQMADMLGYSVDEMAGRPLQSLMDKDGRNQVAKYLDRRARGISEQHEFTFIRKDGSRLFALLETSPMTDSSGEYAGALAMVSDITGRRLAEAELLRLSTVVRLAKEGVVIMDPRGEVFFANDAALGLLGLGASELKGTHFTAMLHPEDREKGKLVLSRTLKMGGISNVELTLQRKAGEPVPVEMSTSVMTAAPDSQASVVAIWRDITEHRRVEREIRSRLMAYNLEEGNLYLVTESTPLLAFEGFRDLLRAGYRGVVLSRTPPSRSDSAPARPFDFIWLSEKDAGRGLRPRLGVIERWLEALPRNRAVLFDRLDYLITKNGPGKTLHFVQMLGELAYLMGHIIILSLDPATVDAKTLRAMEKEAHAIEPRTRPPLPNDRLEVLKYVYHQGLAGAKPTLTEVGRGLGLSKPTARKRVRDLVRWGHLAISTRGRAKVLELTEKGRAAFLN